MDDWDRKTLKKIKGKTEILVRKVITLNESLEEGKFDMRNSINLIREISELVENVNVEISEFGDD